jgi:hypothetical protein
VRRKKVYLEVVEDVGAEVGAEVEAEAVETGIGVKE